MTNRNYEVEQGFYQACAELLNAEYTYKPFLFYKPTRWNNREPGNGRYIGHGFVRMFGSRAIHVQLHNPRVSGSFTSPEAALAAIRAAL
jgi:hypothetical protein